MTHGIAKQRQGRIAHQEGWRKRHKGKVSDDARALIFSEGLEDDSRGISQENPKSKQAYLA